MPTMQCHNVLAFVEGTMEKLFVNNNFRNIVLIPIDNGNSWTTERLCQQVITKFKARNLFPELIIIWMDREDNPDDPSSIASAFKQAFGDEGFPADKVHCLIPDVMTENIILADEELMISEFNEISYNYCYEGKNGKHILKGIYAKTSRTYREALQGPQLLKKIRLSRAGRRSPAVANFLNGLPLTCWWIESELVMRAFDLWR